MKVKELLKTVNVAWSPQPQHPIMLAAGTAAQQLDASFSTSASLDLYSLDLQQPGYEMELQASVPSDHRFHKIIWGSYGNNPAGIIVGGCDYGTINIYSAAKLLAKESNYLISSPDRHTGPVRAMDFNPFQANLLATGATESEIYIWDVVNTNTPMTPGSRSQPLEDVQYIAWNKQVQHILASTFTQCCVIWDLRKNEPIIKLTDATSRVRWKVVQWHPNIATQLCLASEDDQAPVIELWDLRFAMSPLKTLQGHQRGVLSIAWNLHDPDLLLSCAKDNRILCWNPNSAPNGEIICELAQTKQWNFDVSWCPRHPGLIAGSSFDGHAVVYSLLGGQQIPVETSNKIVDSFPGMDPFTQPPPTVQTEAAVILTKAPKWLKRPFGASFGFGGKLVIFENLPLDPQMVNSNRKVFISQIITQPDLIQRSDNLETTLRTEQYDDYCKEKMDKSSDEHTRKTWSCVRAYFSENMPKNILELLGYNVEAMNNKLNQFIPQDDMKNIAEGMSNLNVLNGNIMDGSAAFDAIAQEQSKKATLSNQTANSNYAINTSDDEDGLITQAILLGNIEAAVSLCFSTKRYADAVILSMAAGPELLARTQYRYFSEHSGALNSLISSLVSENWAEVVNQSDIKNWKEVLIGIFTHSSVQKERSVLCDMLGDRLTTCENLALRKQAQICYICSGNLNKLIEVSDADIQEVVELVVIMQKALETQGIQEIEIEDKVATVLSQYAEMLATEGSLETALNYLGNSQEQNIVMLKDRLCRALGYIQDQRHITKSTTQNYYEQTRKFSHSSQNTYNPLQQATPVQNWNTTPLTQTYGIATNQYNPQSAQTYGMPPPLPQPQTQSTMFDQYSTSHMYNQIPTTQPPPPPPTSSSNLSGSRPSSVGPQSKSKYVIDPSVKSTPSYSQNSYLSQNQYMPQQAVPLTSYPSQNPYQPQVPMSGNTYPPNQPQVPMSGNIYSPNQPQVPMPGNTYPPNQPQSFMNNPKEPEPYKSLQPNVMPPLQNTPQTQMYDPTKSQPHPQTQMYGNENIHQFLSQPSGWNDPPIGKGSRMQPKTESQSQNTILHPLRGGQPEPNLLPQDNFYQEPHTSYNPTQYGQNVPNNALLNKPIESSQPAMPTRMVEPEKPKAPIPEQHMHLKTILDELRNQCYENGKNQPIKRKLEDVSRKLEVLYDCLRENKLSQNTLQALHKISQMIQNGNYTGGLELHTQLVSGPDFSQIASFMPGIKVLLLSALQLGVYIR